MDPVCHTLAGAALGEAGLKRQSAMGMATLVLAANAPDMDVAVFATDTLQMYFRRGWTHGVLAMAVLPVLLTGLMLAWDRLVRQRRANPPAPANASGLLLLAFIGTWSHPFLDWLNSYGVRLLMPFSNQWFYGDALYIVDPWMYVLLGGGLVAAQWRRRRGGDPRPLARAGLVLAGVYIVAMFSLSQWAQSEVREGLARAGRGDASFMVTPVPVNPFRREVIVDTGDRYEKGLVWFTPTPRFRPSGFGVDTRLADPLAQQAAATPLARQFLAWSRFPFYVIERGPDGTTVVLNDYRYSDQGGRAGWAGVEIDVP